MGKRLFASPFFLGASAILKYPLSFAGLKPFTYIQARLPHSTFTCLITWQLSNRQESFWCIFIKNIKQTACFYYKFYLTLQRLTMRRVMFLTDGSN